MGFEHEGVVALLLGGGLAHAHHAGNVGGAVVVVRAGVHQEQALAFDIAEFFLGGDVVRQGAVGVETGMSTEAEADKVGLLLAVFELHIVNIQLADALAGSQFLLEFGKEAAQSHAVLHHGFDVVLDFGIALASFEFGAGVEAFNQFYAGGQVAEGGHGGAVGVDEKAT